MIIAQRDSGAFVALAHLRAGSIRVAIGEEVTTGQPVADCGNSGNSTQPHVHLQVMDSPNLSIARDVPMAFRCFREWPRGAKQFRVMYAMSFACASRRRVRRSGSPATSPLPCQAVRMIVRPRVPLDVDACERLARIVYATDGYPPRLPDSLRDFVNAPGALGAWVADRDRALLGQVVLNPSSSPEVIAAASTSTSRPTHELAVVARLLVAPAERRSGIARRLLAAAAAEAHARELWPILDVATHFAGAIALYERCGWRRVAQVTVQIPGADPLDEFVYVGPAPVTPTPRSG